MESEDLYWKIGIIVIDIYIVFFMVMVVFSYYFFLFCFLVFDYVFLSDVVVIVSC